jgi:hypothetical protein
LTSAARSFAVRKEGPTTVLKPESATYYASDLDLDVLFPFSYSNGVLDISYSGNRFKQQMVDSLNQSPNGETDTVIRVMGGPQLVSSLGDNFKAYIRAWRDGTIDAGSPILIHIAPQVFRVQEAEYNSINAGGSSYRISTQPPSGDTYTIGSELDQYRSVYVFKTPMTISIVESGVVQYITFRTLLDQE